jgi:glucose-6-phosphate isomerase
MEIDLTKLVPDTRKLNDMRGVLADPAYKTKNSSDTDLYFMYRGIEQKNGLRYDITIIPAKMIGFEFVKTKGHYHLENWQEVYTVLKGTAIYLLQKKNLNGEISDVYAVTAKESESIIIPPGYGHVTINPSEAEELTMANWISPDCKVDYLSYEKLQGACYYYTKNGWIKNKNYQNTPELRFEEALKSLPKNLDFLKKN